jgi:hypothetical protein
MKQKLFSITTILILGFLSLNILAQTQVKTQSSPAKTRSLPATKTYYPKRIDTVKNTDFSLNGQYQFMLSRSKFLYGAKLINPTRLNSVWKSVSDTLRK